MTHLDEQIARLQEQHKGTFLQAITDRSNKLAHLQRADSIAE